MRRKKNLVAGRATMKRLELKDSTEECKLPSNDNCESLNYFSQEVNKDQCFRKTSVATVLTRSSPSYIRYWFRLDLEVSSFLMALRHLSWPILCTCTP